jgi:predicted O-methyltransferase YrrM
MSASFDQRIALELHKIATRRPHGDFLRPAAQLRIADHLADGPRSSAELADAIGADPDALQRFLRACAVIGLVSETTPDRFENTELGAALRSGTVLHHVAIASSCPALRRPTEAMADAVLSGKRVIKQVLGVDRIWDYYSSHPEEDEHYAALMTVLSERTGDDLAQVFDLSRFSRVVDIGGSSGVLLTRLLEAAPNLTGAVFERPSYQEAATALFAERGLSERAEFIGGSFLDGVPEGADLYVIKHVFCDWPDQAMAKVLAHCREASKPGAVVLIIDWVLPDTTERTTEGGVEERFAGEQLHLQNFIQLLTLDGKLRTWPEFRDLLHSEGFEAGGYTPFSDGLNYIEAVRR